MIEIRTAKNGAVTSGSALAQNVLWNLIGQAAPLAVAVFAIPLLIRGLGTERFGILAIAWSVMGYFSLFDFGLGRALTQMVAQELGRRKDGEIHNLVWTALVLMLLFGTFGAVVVSSLSPWLVHNVLKISVGFQAESLSAFYLLAASLPIVLLSVGLRGVLEAQQLFRLSSAIRIPTGVLSFLAPVLVLPLSRSLFVVVAALFASRCIACLAYFLACLRTVPSLRQGISLKRRIVVPLLRFGGWMTVSNIVNPLMVYLDRFLIGALISATAVAYYATPYEMVTKVGFLSSALAGVLFPAFATSFSYDRGRTMVLFHRASKYFFLVLFPATLLVVTLARDGLAFWLGPDFASHSARVLQWLAIGVFANGLAQIPFALLQGAGRPDLTAKLNFIELPIYLPTLWWLLVRFGIEGAACAWTIRVMLECLLLFAMAYRLLPTNTTLVRRMVLTVGAGLLMMGVGSLLPGLVIKALFLFVTLSGFVLAAWFVVLSAEERAFGRRAIELAKLA